MTEKKKLSTYRHSISSSSAQAFSVRNQPLRGENSYERAKILLRQILENLDNEDIGGPIPTTAKLDLLRDHAKLTARANRLWRDRNTISGTLGFSYKSEKLEYSAQKLKEAIDFHADVARMRINAVAAAKVLSKKPSSPSFATASASSPPRKPSRDQSTYPSVLKPYEAFWCDNFRWLESCDYRLRTRYHPSWAPSWGPRSDGAHAEDARFPPHPNVIDAIRLSDMSPITLKKINKSSGSVESLIASMFSSPQLRKTRENHCVPILETLTVPHNSDSEAADQHWQILVMPRLRVYESPRFESLGEILEMIRQIFEGLKFMHDNSIAHGDIHLDHIMYDACKLFPHGYHPIAIDRTPDYTSVATHLNRLEVAPTYYIVDFSRAQRYNPKKTTKGDLFKNDVCMLGKSIGDTFLQPDSPYAPDALAFMIPLVNQMVDPDPSHRPSIDDVVLRFDKAWRALGVPMLRLSLAPSKQSVLGGLVRRLSSSGRNEKQPLVTVVNNRPRRLSTSSTNDSPVISRPKSRARPVSADTTGRRSTHSRNTLEYEEHSLPPPPPPPPPPKEDPDLRKPKLKHRSSSSRVEAAHTPQMIWSDPTTPSTGTPYFTPTPTSGRVTAEGYFDIPLEKERERRERRRSRDRSRDKERDSADRDREYRRSRRRRTEDEERFEPLSPSYDERERDRDRDKNRPSRRERRSSRSHHRHTSDRPEDYSRHHRSESSLKRY